MKIYISLPISGYPIEERVAYANMVRNNLIEVISQTCGFLGRKKNLRVVTPFDICPEPDKPYSYYMGKDIEALLECDAIYLCEGWQNSKGCMAEFEVARIYGKEIMFESWGR